MQEHGDAETLINEEFARVGKAFASPRRIEILQLLSQGERSVEALAKGIDSGLANTSGHLQILRQAGLVLSRRVGTKVFYRLADDEVARFLISLGDLARHRLAEVERLLDSYREEGDSAVAGPDLLKLQKSGKVRLLDVRPAVEFEAGHVPGALSMPLDELSARIGELPSGSRLVVYCRGAFSSLSTDAIRLLRDAGHEADRLEIGFPEWRLRGLPVEGGGSPEAGVGA